MTKWPVPVSKGWPAPVYKFGENPLTESGIYLGRKLFYETMLSADSSISCASCHSPYNAFAHTDHALSHGLNDSMGRRNAPALFNLAWQHSFMHDGAIHHLDMVPLAPIEHPTEMGSNLKTIIKRLKDQPTYVVLYKEAFGSEEITGAATLKAMSQFLVTLVSNMSKYDSVMSHKQQFTEKEALGYELFKNYCASCHKEPLFTDVQYYYTGLPMNELIKDHGRMEITGNPNDDMAFKVPTLRNLVFTYPYMHDGRFRTLYGVLDHYTKGNYNCEKLPDALQRPILLTSEDKTNLIAFLHTLTDKRFVFNDSNHFPY